LTFETPSQWQDRTLVAYEAPRVRPDQLPASLIVARQLLAPGETLDRHAERAAQAMVDRIPGARVVGRMKRVVGGRRAIETRVTWTEPEGPIEHTVVHVEPGSTETEPRVTAFAFITSDGGARAALGQIMSTVRFGDAAPPPPPLLCAPPRAAPAPMDLEFSMVPMPGVPRAPRN
jgi:hypothetical protein